MREKAEKSNIALLHELAIKHKSRLDISFSLEDSESANTLYRCKVVLDDRELGTGIGPSKKKAQRDACQQAVLCVSQDDALKVVAFPRNPISELNEWASQRSAVLKYESAVICRTFADGTLVAIAEGDTAKSAKRNSCRKALSALKHDLPTPASLPLTPSTENTPAGLYLLQKIRELQPSIGESVALNALTSAVLATAEGCKLLGAVDIVKIGSCAIGCMRRGAALDFAIVQSTEGPLDQSTFAPEFCKLLAGSLHPQSCYKKAKLAEAHDSLQYEVIEGGFSVKHTTAEVRLVVVAQDSAELCHALWAARQELSQHQSAVLVLLRLWRRKLRTPVPSELLDWLTVTYCKEMNVGDGFRKAMERLSGGEFLSSHCTEPFHQAILSSWHFADRVKAMGEAFVTLVQLAKNEVAALM